MSEKQPWMAALLRLYQSGKRRLPEPPDNTPELPDSCWDLDKWYHRRAVRSSGSGAATPGSTSLPRR